MKKLLNAVAVAAALVGASTANAGTLVTDWGYSVTTQWQVPFTTFSAGSGTQTSTSSLISWGAAGGDHTVTNAASTAARSALEITNSPATGPVATNTFTDPISTPPPAYGLTAVMTHYNNTLDGGFATMTKTRVETALTLTPTNPAGPTLPTVMKVFGIDFKETPNISGTCAAPSATTCDDIFVVSLGDLTQSFDYDGFHYTVGIFEVSGNLDVLSNAQCLAAGAAIGCIGLTTPEKEHTPVQFAFFINAVELPEPAGLALFAAALFALGATVRRKSS
ncbi:MAG TPA: THxN family PEP-CTERM protein [Burkholderiaceae bacterium]|nr:THxN family PEP-CTERM protein [Burkholderiaceae bacterium]